MYQQHGIGWPGLLRGPRVGIGVLALGMAAAFVAGGIVVSLVAGNLAVPPALMTTGTQNHTLAEDSREAGITSSSGLPGLNVGDFGPAPAAPAARTASVVSQPGLNVGDFGPAPAAPAARTASTVRLPGLNVGDFGPAPAARTESVVSQPGLNVGD